MPLYTPLGGSWLNMTESIPRILIRRGLAGTHPKCSSPHTAPRVRSSSSAGCRRFFLPPNTPDLNPIEPAWSELKALLRGVGARIT
jgi:transposase